MQEPILTIQASPTGVTRVLVTFDRGDRLSGLALVERAVPILRVLEAALRGHEPNTQSDGAQ